MHHQQAAMDDIVVSSRTPGAVPKSSISSASAYASVPNLDVSTDQKEGSPILPELFKKSEVF